MSAGKSFKIVFMGSPDFAVPSLQILAESKHSIISVVTGTDKKRGRGSDLSPTPVKNAAIQLGIPVLEFDQMKDPELQEKLTALKPDLLVVVAFKLLPDHILDTATFGAVNLHASLLPKFRGAAPIHHAVMQGEKYTGCTIFKLDSGMDTGGIILQDALSIGVDETTGSVYNRLMHAGSELLLKAVHLLSDGSAVIAHQDSSKATAAPKLFDEDCHVDFNRPAQVVHNHIRGLSPFPCAYTRLDGKKLKLIESSWNTIPNKEVKPGTLMIKENQVFVSCSDAAIELVTVQFEGKRALPAIDFIRGYQGEKNVG